MDEKHTQLLSILQVCDSIFPTGGFAHSVGMESFEKFGLLKSTDQLNKFVSCALQNTGSLLLPFVNEAFSAAGDEKVIISLDSLCEACLTNHVANRASVKQGRSLLDSSCTVFQSETLGRMEDLLYDKKIRGHMPVVFGVVCKSLGINKMAALQMFLFETLRNIVASAVRLGNVGALEAQRLQFNHQKRIPVIARQYSQLNTEDAHVCYPLLEVVQNSHDKLFSKLFYS